MLVVEDNLLVQTITKKLLEKLGYSVLTANDGVEGVATIQTYKKENRAVSLVLMVNSYPFCQIFIRYVDFPIFLGSGHAKYVGIRSNRNY